LINRPLFRKITRRIEYFGGSKACSSSRCLFIHARIDHRQLGATLQIDPPHAFTPPPNLAKTKRAAFFFVLHRRDWIEFTRVRSLRCTSRKQRCLRSRESSRGGTLERLLYIYYWSAISQRNIANRSDKIEQRSSIQDDVCNRWTNLEVIINTSDLSKTIVHNLK